MPLDTLLRASSLTEFPDCERRFASRHLADLVGAAGFQLRRLPMQIGAKVGTAVHAGAAHLLRHKIATGENVLDGNGALMQAAQEVGVESLRAEVNQGAVWDEVSPTINTAEHQTRRMLFSYAMTIVPTIQPVAVEQELVARFSPRIRLIGHLDIAEDLGIDDNKTGARQRPNHPQYGAYSLLRRSNGAEVSRFREHYVPRVPIKQDQPVPTTTTYPVETCEQAAHAVLGRVEESIKRFEKSSNPWEWIPNPASMLCSDRFCSAWGTSFCLAHARKS